MLPRNKHQAATLARHLARALGARAQVTQAPHSPSRDAEDRTAVLLTTPAGRTSTLVPIPAGAGYPQDVRTALLMLDLVTPGDVPVVVARHLSPGARTLLDDRGLSWADEEGNLRVSAGPVVVAVDGPPPPVTERRAPTEMSWADASGAVAELILERATATDRHTEIEAVTSIGDRLGISAASVSRTLKRFDAIGWTRRSGPGRGPQVVRHLSDPGAMLSSWAAWSTQRTRRTTVAHALVPDIEGWLRRLATAWPAGCWAVTGEAAAQIRAPHLSRVSVVELYIEPDLYDDDLDSLLNRAELTPVPTGGRVRLLRADRYLRTLIAADPGAHELPLVPDIRLYADLMSGGVRGDEAASALRDRRIGF